MEIFEKNNRFVFAFFALVVLCGAIGGAGVASAEHEAIVTIDPDIANCEELGNTFTVNVENDGNADSDDILQVEIYKALAGISDFECGPAPSGWNYLPWPGEDRCIYVTGLTSPDKIAHGEDLDFTFDAVMSSDSCESEFIVVSVDDASPTGHRDTNIVDVDIDCSAPELIKIIGEPKIACDPDDPSGCNYWITHDTLIEVFAYDNETGNQCNLGLEYCAWRYKVDDGSWSNWENHTNGDSIHFDFSFDEDSVHIIEIECFDVAGNKAYHTQIERVDDTPPETEKTYGTPHRPQTSEGDDYDINDPDAPYPHFITTETPITLDAPDGGEICAIGTDKTWYIDYLVPDEFCEAEQNCIPLCEQFYENEGTAACIDANQEYCADYWDVLDDPSFSSWEECVEYYTYADCGIVCSPYGGDFQIAALAQIPQFFTWELYDGTPFTKDEESCHIIQFFSVDELGNVEEMNHQCVNVDDTPPEADKTVGEPKEPLCELELTESDEVYTEDDMSNDAFGVTVTKSTDADSVKWTVEFDGDDISGHWSTGVQVVIADESDPLFLLGWSPGESTTDPIYKEYDGGWGSPTTTLPAGMSVSGNYNEEYYEIVVPKSYLAGCPYYWAINTEATWPGHSSSVQQNYPANWGRWTADNAAVGGYGNNWWVTQDTEITLTCTDPQPHPVGDEAVCFLVSYDQAEIEPDVFGYGFITEEYCEELDGIMDGDVCCVEDNSITFEFEEDSLHDLEFYCRDGLYNTGPSDLEWFRVDTEEPYLTDKWIDGPYYEVSGTGQICPPDSEDDVCHLDGDSYIYIDVEDGGEICAIDDVWCQWGYFLDDGGFYGWYQEFPIHFPEETKHDLVIECYDALGNKMVDEETFYVDKTPPETTRTYQGPFYEDDGVKWIDTISTIELTATDDVGPHDSGVYETYYRYVTLGTNEACYSNERCQEWNGEMPGWQIYSDDPFGLPESCHLIEYYSVDNVGKEEDVQRECVFSDHTPPIVSADTGEPKISCEEGEGCDYWIQDHVTPVTLSCYDPEPHPSGVDRIEYRWTLDGQWPASNPTGEWLLYEEPIIFEEDSVHELEYRCFDNVEKMREGPGKIYKVDSIPPTTTKTFIPDPYIVEGVEWIDTVHEIELDAVDGGDTCAVGVDKIWYMNVIDLTENACWEPDIYCEPLDFPTPYESIPVVPFYEDATECINEKQEMCDMFMSLPPIPGIPPMYESWEECVESFVYDECGVDPLWKLYDGTPIEKPEESCHVLQYFSVDDLGNIEDMNVNCFFVDKTPPVIEKEYEGPYLETNSAEYISSETDVLIDVYDPEPHPSGVASVEYRVTLLDDNDYCDDADEGEELYCDDAVGEGDWIPASEEFDFNIPDDSCHLIEVHAVDNVGKESMHRQCVFVDNQYPDPIKTVGQPNSKIYPEDYTWIYYPEVNGNCWTGEEGSIDCWKVTTLTPIVMSCDDPDPHPVNHEKICFHVDFDAMDYTQQHCNKEVIFDEVTEKTMCCYEYEEYKNEIQDGVWLYFSEESEHELEFFCEDALGNRGPLDIEKFKVEGTAFEIPIFKKWNLISVPFQLLDEDPEAVFENVSDAVEEVWTYDTATDTWYGYSSEYPEASDLEAIEPGWGYWVFGNEYAELKIGGSLFEPGPYVPVERLLSQGWNLIGYYGTEWQDYNEVVDPCMYGRGLPFYNNVYNSLYSLMDVTVMDPEEGDEEWAEPNWNSLWTFQTCGIDDPTNQPYWLPLDYGDKMYPGYGFWIHMDEDDMYAPTFKELEEDWCWFPWCHGGFD